MIVVEPLFFSWSSLEKKSVSCPARFLAFCLLLYQNGLLRFGSLYK